MRISSQQIFQNGVRNIQLGQSNIANLQNQISTGKKLLRPSDDPVAAAQILKLRRELESNQVFNENITVAERRLSLQEIALQQINDAGDRLQELALQANNGALTSSERAGIVSEISEIQDFMLGVMNTRDAQGEYIFAGARSGTRPFEESPPGTFTYQGDAESRLIQIGSENFIQSTDSGQAVFQRIVGPPALSGLTQADRDNLNLQTTDLAAFKRATSTLAQATGSGNLVINVTNVDPVTGTYDFEVLADDAPTNTVLGSFSGVAPGTEVELSVNNPANGLLNNGDSLGLKIDAGQLPALGPITVAADGSRHSLLTTAQNLIDGLTNETSSEGINRVVSQALQEIEQGQTALVQSQSQLGGRLNTLENQRSINEDFEIFNQSALSSLEDLDFAEALSKFSFQEVALQAAQQTFSRVTNLSLFNFL